MSKLYRPNAAVVVFNKNGSVLVFKRKDFEDQWQFPQGGIESNENPKEAAFRELKEETNITTAKFIAEYPEPLKYNFPINVLQKFKKLGRNNIGQVQFWFLLFWNDEENEINLETNPQEIEFCDYKWIDIEDSVNLIVDFKKDVYRKITTYFAPIIEEYIKKFN